MSMPISKNILRRYILLTLSHVEKTPERRELFMERIVLRLTQKFVCKSVVISREYHRSLGGLHYHVGIWNESASKNTACAILRKMFVEFEGYQCNVSFHKGWNTICRYLLKEDKTPYVWGEESLDLIKDRANSCSSKRRGPDLVKALRSKNSWKEVMEDDNLVRKCLSSYNSVRNTYADLQAFKDTSCFLLRLTAYVEAKGEKVYSAKDLKERWHALEWLVYNLCRERHLRQRQLLILGKPSTNKTNFVQALSEFLSVYFVPRRLNDFTGAEKEHDLWVIDELSGYGMELEMLNMILDGQKIALDSKYGRIFEKTRNVPIILISNSVPYNYVGDSFLSRIFRLYFFSGINPIEPSRLASTLFTECLKYYYIFKKDWESSRILEEVENKVDWDKLSDKLDYPLVPVAEGRRIGFRLSKEDLSEVMLKYERFGSGADIVFPTDDF